MQVVWFKRDLRCVDHEPLHLAVATGKPVLPLYILEPELWAQPDMSHRHYAFLCDCLDELSKKLASLGQPLVIMVGDAVSVLEDLFIKYSLETLWSHQETWNGWTYERDKRVSLWVKSKGISWREPTQHGVVRRLAKRDGWALKWYQSMKKSLIPAPHALLNLGFSGESMPAADALGLVEDGCLSRQPGGRRAGLAVLKSFLYKRGEHYSKDMSSPLTAFKSCSRLSPHIAFGTLSLREIFQITSLRAAELADLPASEKGKWPSAMRSFLGRLRWHCHFIQKLEDEPDIEYRNLHSAYDGLRDHNPDYFDAWKKGQTGYPMVDACMRALTAHGWINFRMRAMLMSFASNHLWLDWRETALHLATLFTDYEPGIHYSQVQMQSGTTGINSIRIYNPIKQGLDQDPEGVFIRRWLPELSEMPLESLHTPWKEPSLMNGYPMPIVDEKIARTSAAARLYGLRKDDSHRLEAKGIVVKHASRKTRTKKIK